jgi:hypothetical protein
LWVVTNVVLMHSESRTDTAWLVCGHGRTCCTLSLLVCVVHGSCSAHFTRMFVGQADCGSFLRGCSGQTLAGNGWKRFRIDTTTKYERQDLRVLPIAACQDCSGKSNQGGAPCVEYGASSCTRIRMISGNACGTHVDDGVPGMWKGSRAQKRQFRIPYQQTADGHFQLRCITMQLLRGWMVGGWW